MLQPSEPTGQGFAAFILLITRESPRLAHIQAGVTEPLAGGEKSKSRITEERPVTINFGKYSDSQAPCLHARCR